MVKNNEVSFILRNLFLLSFNEGKNHNVLFITLIIIYLLSLKINRDHIKTIPVI
jgi:hypothetical protein